MAAFVAGEVHVLVATTVIEVGVDVPNATLMVIEHAERFGLAQLHQLRGRVGRGAADSTCFLLFEEPLGETAKARLKVIYENTDGFEIARQDLVIRGPGEFLGARQSGVPLLRFADLEKDAALIEQARDAARSAARDPEAAAAARGALAGRSSGYKAAAAALPTPRRGQGCRRARGDLAGAARSSTRSPRIRCLTRAGAADTIAAEVRAGVPGRGAGASVGTADDLGDRLCNGRVLRASPRYGARRGAARDRRITMRVRCARATTAASGRAAAKCWCFRTTTSTCWRPIFSRASSKHCSASRSSVRSVPRGSPARRGAGRDTPTCTGGSRTAPAAAATCVPPSGARGRA
jgi:superfamily II DNA/RNA helicase